MISRVSPRVTPSRFRDREHYDSGSCGQYVRGHGFMFMPHPSCAPFGSSGRSQRRLSWVVSRPTSAPHPVPFLLPTYFYPLATVAYTLQTFSHAMTFESISYHQSYVSTACTRVDKKTKTSPSVRGSSCAKLRYGRGIAYWPPAAPRTRTSANQPVYCS